MKIRFIGAGNVARPLGRGYKPLGMRFYLVIARGSHRRLAAR